MWRRLPWLLPVALALQILGAAPLTDLPTHRTPDPGPTVATPSSSRPPVGPADPDGRFDPSPADVAAAVEVMTRDDDGVVMPVIRFEADRVTVRAVGPAVEPGAVADVDRVLAWLTAATGTRFVRVDRDEADIVVHLDRDVAPHAHTWAYPGDWRILRIEVFYDPANPRWPWEEIVGSVGAFGDWANHRLSIFSTDQTLTAPSPFDAWLVRQLYTVPPGTPPETLAGLLTEG